MWVWAMAMRWRVLSAVVIGGTLIGSPASANEAAHSLAKRFAEDTATKPAEPASDRDRQILERKLEQEERLRADEAEMLERAKSEADERRAAEQKAADAAREAEAQRAAAEKAEAERAAAERAEAERVAAEAAAAASLAAERQKAQDDEAADKAARERAARESERIKAAEQRRRSEEQAARDAEKAKAEQAEAEKALAEKEKARQAQEAEQRRIAAEKDAAQQREIAAAKARIESAKQADDQRRMEAQRKAEADRLSEKLQRSREQRAAKDLGQGYSGLGAPTPTDQTTETLSAYKTTASQHPSKVADEHTHAARDEPVRGDSARATILLVMQPGTRGIRRRENTGDPIICSGSQCFVSEGAETQARAMTRARAFGPGNTLGQRAGACRHSLVCIFRDVDLRSETFALQAIDMRILRHDRREQVTADVDHTCRLASGRLACAEPIVAGSYRAWVVPERLARQAGPEALRDAIDAGLPAPATTARRW